MSWRWSLIVLSLGLAAAGCGKMPPGNDALVKLVEQDLGLASDPSSSQLMREAAVQQLPENEKVSAMFNPSRKMECTYLGTKVIKRGPVTRAQNIASMPFRIQVKGRAVLNFLYSPNANPANNEWVTRNVEFTVEREFIARTDAYGEWKVSGN
jgi:hypothetical protein